MKNQIVFIALSILTTVSATAQVGKVVYLEGTVEVLRDSWAALGIDDQILLDDNIRTASGSLLEIQWVNGLKTTIEPSSKYAVNEIYNAEDTPEVSRGSSILARIKKVLSSGGPSVATEEAGVRRSQATVVQRDTNHIYWKEDDRIALADVYKHYKGREYVQSVSKAKVWLMQNPTHGKRPSVLLLLSDSYIQLNNFPMAKSTLEDFTSEYPSDPLAKDATALLDIL